MAEAKTLRPGDSIPEGTWTLSNGEKMYLKPTDTFNVTGGNGADACLEITLSPGLVFRLPVGRYRVRPGEKNG